MTGVGNVRVRVTVWPSFTPSMWNEYRPSGKVTPAGNPVVGSVLGEMGVRSGMLPQLGVKLAIPVPVDVVCCDDTNAGNVKVHCDVGEPNNIIVPPL